jgi:adenylate cyclase
MTTFVLVSLSDSERNELAPGRSYIVGRAVTSDIPIYDPTISRRHAELTPLPTGVRVRDLGSSNGTFINGTKIETGMLAEDDAVTFGKVQCQLRGVASAELPKPVETKSQVPGGTIVRQVSVSAAGKIPLAGLSQEELQGRRLALLLDVSQTLAGEFDPDKLLTQVVDTTFDVMGVDRVAILLADPESGELIPKVSRSRLGDEVFEQVPRSIVHKAMEERIAILTDNAAADERFKGQSVVVQSVRSAMCTPLVAQSDSVLGVLYVDNLAATEAFSDDDLQFLIAYAGIAAVAISKAHYAERLQREALVRSNFERYFAPNVAAAIVDQQEDVVLGGDKRPVTILFSDIRGFTTLSEGMMPGAIAHLLTEYFTEMVDILFEYGGTLDKFIGDAVMALWGAPIAAEGDQERALEAAIAMQRGIGELNAKWQGEGRPPIGVGIGINHGDVFVGNIGSQRRLEYTVIGDAVNVASRLASKAGPGEIIISEPFYSLLATRPDVEKIDEVDLKGKAKPIAVYRVKV